MNELNVYPGMTKITRWSFFALVPFLIFASVSAPARQNSASVTIDGSQTIVESVYELRSRAGVRGITELMVAAQDGDIEKAQQLIIAGADVNEGNQIRETPLMWAARSGGVNMVNFLITQGADVRVRTVHGSSAVHYAIFGRRENAALALIGAGADINERSDTRMDYLEMSAEYGMTNTVEALIRNGTDLDTYGASALHYAVSGGHVDIVGLLLSAGVDVNTRNTRSHESILYAASASGNLSLVTLLLSWGADVNQLTYKVLPMYPAASSGHSAIVEALVANGAAASPRDLRLAAESGHLETAIILSKHIDFETTHKSEIENLLAVAENLDQAALIQSMLESHPVKQVRNDTIRAAEEARLSSQREHSRLLFVRQGEKYCVVGIWDSKSGVSTELSRVSTCPYTIFTSKDANSVFVVGRNIIQIVSIDSPAEKLDVKLPDLDYRVWTEQMEVRPDQNPNFLPSAVQMNLKGVGRFNDGSLGMVASVEMPARNGAQYQYLFRQINGQWSFSDGQWCGRWQCEYTIGELAFKSTNGWFWPESRAIWHPNVSLNPFFSAESIDLVDQQYEGDQGARHHREFEIDGVSSVLTAYTFRSGDSGATLTSRVELTIDDNQTRFLSQRQCLTSVVGRFILVDEFFGSRFEVTDIGTGKTMIDNLTAAMWLD